MRRTVSCLLVLLLLGCGCFAVSAAEDEPHTHIFGAWYTVTSPTCTEPGEEQRMCEVCEAVETNEIEPSGHKWSNWEETLAPTCTEAGEEHRTCEVCEAVETRIIEPGHQWGDWYAVTEPACSAPGENRRDCARCGAAETAVLPVLGHLWVTDPAVPATCTTEGKTEGIHCSRCGAVLSGHRQATLKPLGHAVLDENGDCVLCGAHVKDLCPYCHRDHTAQLFGRLIAWFHQIFYRIRLRFQ
jgi:hypothetical protein